MNNCNIIVVVIISKITFNGTFKYPSNISNVLNSSCICYTILQNIIISHMIINTDNKLCNIVDIILIRPAIFVKG